MYDASFAYDGITVVEGLNFHVTTGDYLCIVGENGSGKSTLMKGILGLIKPKSGKISIASDLKQTEIGYLPQQNQALKHFPASVHEVVISGRLSARGIRPFFSKSDRKAAAENMERVGVLDLRNKSFRELSGGQQQRVMLARALCATKKALLLDEPAAGLDPLVTDGLYATIKSLRDETGITIIMISHDMLASVNHASHILHLKNRQLFFGATEDYRQTKIGRMFLREEGDDGAL